MDREFVKRLWEKYKPKHMSYIEVRNLYNYFLELCNIYHIDPKTIDFESVVDWSLSYEENKKLLERFFPVIEEERIEAMEKALERAYEIRKEPEYLNLLKELREIREKLSEFEKKVVTKEEFEKLRSILEGLSNIAKVVSKLPEEVSRIERISRRFEEIVAAEEEARIMREEKTKTIVGGFVDYLKRISEILPLFEVVSVRKGIPKELSDMIGTPSISYSVVLDIADIDLGMLDRDAIQQALEYVAAGDLESLKKLNIYSDLYVTKGPTRKVGVVMGYPRVLPVFSPDFSGYAIFWIDRSKIEDFSYLEDEPEEKIVGILASRLLYYIFYLDHETDWKRIENSRKSFRLFRNGFIIYRLKDDSSYRNALEELLFTIRPKLPVEDNPVKLELLVPTVYEETDVLPIIKELQEKYGGEIEIVSADKAEELAREMFGVSPRG